MPFFQHDGLQFHYREAGAGLPLVFQHGLGGDVDQPFGVFQPPAGFRMLAFDCRAHGETQPLGPPDKIGIGPFADDLAFFLDRLQIQTAIVGGISMGAAVALNFATRFPDRVLGLVLSRAAWLTEPTPANVRIFSHIAQLIREHGVARGLVLFRESAEYDDYLRQSPDSAASLVNHFQNARAKDGVIRLKRIPKDTPIRDMELLKQIRVPTLVMANRQDPIHPFQYGEVLARSIAGAEFVELTPKSVSREQHTADVQRAIEGFLGRHFLKA